jgi:hypothetical protein
MGFTLGFTITLTRTLTLALTFTFVGASLLAIVFIGLVENQSRASSLLRLMSGISYG